MAQGSTMLRQRSQGAKNPRRDVDQIMKSLGTLPRILCWNCRQLTPFELDRCQHCGSAFAGGTGGAYRSGRIPKSDSFARAEGGSTRLRRDPMLLRRLVRRVTCTQVSRLRTVGEIPYHSTSSFFSRRTHPRRKELQPAMKPKRPRISYRKTYYLVLWWMSQTPYAAIFENQVAAEAAANVRNALLVTISGRDAKVDQILDWYRRDESGRPMPAEWRDLVGQIHVPWLAKPKATV